jgi:hypothetical protein
MSEKEKRAEELAKEHTKKLEPELIKKVEEGKQEPAFRELFSRFENRYYFFTGIIIGIVFGILGNLLATNGIELLRVSIISPEGWILANGVMFFSVLLGTIAFVFWVRGVMKRDKEKVDNAMVDLVSKALFKTNVPMPEELIKLLREDGEKKAYTAKELTEEPKK